VLFIFKKTLHLCWQHGLLNHNQSTTYLKESIKEIQDTLDIWDYIYFKSFLMLERRGFSLIAQLPTPISFLLLWLPITLNSPPSLLRRLLPRPLHLMQSLSLSLSLSLCVCVRAREPKGKGEGNIFLWTKRKMRVVRLGRCERREYIFLKLNNLLGSYSATQYIG
jgi:hypothetical protein